MQGLRWDGYHLAKNPSPSSASRKLVSEQTEKFSKSDPQ